MGDKVAAKRAMLRGGCASRPGAGRCAADDEALVREAAAAIGYPVILKAAGGGGGRGMRVVEREADLLPALALTREEARRGFGNPAIYAEKISRSSAPRSRSRSSADRHGNALWLGSRDCSLQRRHQKVLEEAPRQGFHSARRRGRRALRRRLPPHGLCRRRHLRIPCGGRRFLLHRDENTRVQVEHPVTEMTAGIDIVAEGIRVARGEPLRLDRRRSPAGGTPSSAGSTPRTPRLTRLRPPHHTIRPARRAGRQGRHASQHRRHGLALLRLADRQAHRPRRDTRRGAGAAQDRALGDRGRRHRDELPLHRRLASEPAFMAGGVDIHWLEARLRERAAA